MTYKELAAEIRQKLSQDKAGPDDNLTNAALYQMIDTCRNDMLSNFTSHGRKVDQSIIQSTPPLQLKPVPVGTLDPDTESAARYLPDTQINTENTTPYYQNLYYCYLPSEFLNWSENRAFRYAGAVYGYGALVKTNLDSLASVSSSPFPGAMRLALVRRNVLLVCDNGPQDIFLAIKDDAGEYIREKVGSTIQVYKENGGTKEMYQKWVIVRGVWREPRKVYEMTTDNTTPLEWKEFTNDGLVDTKIVPIPGELERAIIDKIHEGRIKRDPRFFPQERLKDGQRDSVQPKNITQ